MTCYVIVAILINLSSQKWINISLFELVVTCIETHELLPNLSISHIFLCVIFLFCFLLLVKIFTLSLQHSKKCIQHHLYTNFGNISSFSHFIFIHMRLQHVKQITKKTCFLFSFCQVKRMSALVYVP